ncbi:tetratricopeptide repeat protein [Pseudoduganella lutea]|nr:hypothetical protein [Pseudoduganella lutea]
MNLDLPGLAEITYEELAEKLDLSEYFTVNPDHDEEEDEYFGRHQLLFHDGDLLISKNIDIDHYDRNFILIVKGDLEVQGGIEGSFIVTGNLVAESREFEPDDLQYVGGESRIRYLEVLRHPDDEALFELPPNYRSSAPFLFCYFVDLKTLRSDNVPVVWDVKSAHDYDGNETSRTDILWMRGSWGPFILAEQVGYSHVSWLSDDAYGIDEEATLKILKAGQPPFAFQDAKVMLAAYGQAYKAHLASGFDAAYPLLKNLCETYPRFYLPSYHLGTNLAGSGDYQGAMPYLEIADAASASGWHSTFNDAKAYLGHCLLRLGRIGEAEAQVDAVSEESKSLVAHRTRAEIHFIKGENEQALAEAEKARSLDWRSIASNLLLAAIHYRLGNEKSIKDFLGMVERLRPELKVDPADIRNLDFLFGPQKTYVPREEMAT